MKKWQRQCVAVAREAGVERISLLPGGKHLRLLGTVNGQPFEAFISQSAGSQARDRNVRAYIRRAVRAHQPKELWA